MAAVETSFISCVREKIEEYVTVLLLLLPFIYAGQKSLQRYISIKQY